MKKEIVGVLVCTLLIAAAVLPALGTINMTVGPPTVEWVKRYNSPGDGDDVSSGIAVDLSGNIYVTGWSMGDETGDGYATVAYDSSGNELWVARYDGPVHGDDAANGIAVDPSGNVYVTGESVGYETGKDYVTIKYSTTPTVGVGGFSPLAGINHSIRERHC